MATKPTNGVKVEQQAKPAPQEFPVVVPEVNEKKRYSILQFNGPMNIDPAKWTNCELQMCREDNRAHAVGPSAIVQDYGEGSEYGRAAREEARRKRYGRQTRQYHHDKQPWQLIINDPSKQPPERNYRSGCEGGAGEHSDYWIFSKSGNVFQAHKIDDWYRFMPQVRYKTLDIDQAEEQFQHRNKVLNQFALKAQIQQTLNKQEEDGDKLTKVSNLKIKDAQSDSDEDGDDNETKGIKDANAKLEKPTKKGKKPKKDKRQRVDNADDVVKYESEDGEDEGREYDYMSDSGSDTSREEEDVDDKMAKEMVAVGDETGMKSSSEDEDEDEDDEDKDDDKKESKKQLIKKLKEQNEPKEEEDQEMRVVDQVDERDSSGSDSDDPDSPKSKTSVLFMQRKERKRAAEDQPGTSDAKRAKTASREQTPAAAREDKTTPPPAPAQPAVDSLDETTVRRLLLKKPHTTKELLNKIRPHCGEMDKTKIVACLADILRKIEPHQFRQTVNKKDVLFFSLRPP